MTSAALIRRRRSSASLLSLYSALGIRPELAFDFANERYFTSRVPTTFSDAITHTRASTATYVDSSGVLQTAASGEPRVGHHVWNGTAWVNEGLLHESEARTNSLPRNDFAGAVVGVIGSGGSAPTGTSLFNNLGSGAVTTVVATGTEFGMPYIDVRFQGTATASQVCSFTFNATNSVPAVTGQVWTSSCFVRIVAGNFPTAASSIFKVGFSERNGSTTLNFASVSVQVPTTTLNRVHSTRTLSQATTDNLVTYLEMSVQSGAVVDVTFRYYMPQLEQGATPSSPIPTSGSAVTRAADVLTIPSANLPWNPLAVSIQMDGAINFADEGLAAQHTFLRWQLDANNYISVDLDTDSTATGEVNFNQAASGTVDTVATAGTALAPSIATAFNIASRHGSTFINGALNGTALTADTTPVALANLSATDFNLGHDYNGTIKTLRLWAQDVGDAGIAGASA